MIDYIFNSKHQNSDDKLDNKFYSSKSNCEFFDDENNPRVNSEKNSSVLAKIKIKPNGSSKYLVRLDNNKQLYNPNSTRSDNIRNNLANQYLSESNAFREVSKKVFDYYLTFLRTSNVLWLNSAQREDF
jgi:hypothetical protein